MKKFYSLVMAMMLFSAGMFAETATTVYYTASESVIGSYTVKLNVNLKGDGDEWRQYDMTKTDLSYNGDPVYTYSYTDMYDGVGVMQFQLYEGETWKSQNEAINTWTFATEYNGKMFVHATNQWVAAPGGGDQPGGDEPGGGDKPNAYWYYKGYIDGGNLENEEAGYNIFRGGTASLIVEEDAYLFLIYQVTGVMGVQYMTAEYVDGPTHAQMLTTGVEKFHVGAGEYTLYLYDNNDGTVELSTQPMEGKTLIDGGGSQPGEEAVENTVVKTHARKAMIDGRLVIIRGEQMFDATGRAL